MDADGGGATGAIAMADASDANNGDACPVTPPVALRRAKSHTTYAEATRAHQLGTKRLSFHADAIETAASSPEDARVRLGVPRPAGAAAAAAAAPAAAAAAAVVVDHDDDEDEVPDLNSLAECLLCRKEFRIKRLLKCPNECSAWFCVGCIEKVAVDDHYQDLWGRKCAHCRQGEPDGGDIVGFRNPWSGRRKMARFRVRVVRDGAASEAQLDQADADADLDRLLGPRAASPAPRRSPRRPPQPVPVVPVAAAVVPDPAPVASPATPRRPKPPPPSISKNMEVFLSVVRPQLDDKVQRRVVLNDDAQSGGGGADNALARIMRAEEAEDAALGASIVAAVTLGYEYKKAMDEKDFSTATEMANWRIVEGNIANEKKKVLIRNRVMKRLQMARVDAVYPKVKYLDVKFGVFVKQIGNIEKYLDGNMNEQPPNHVASFFAER